MNLKGVFGIAGSLLLGVMSVTAHASLVNVTYTGTLASGTDGLGIFGEKGQSLASDPFSMTFIFDTDIGRVTNDDTGTTPSNYDVAYGGSYFKSQSPLQSATLTINGTSQSITGGVSSDLGFWNYNPGYYEAAAVDTPFSQNSFGTLVYNDIVFGTYFPTVTHFDIDQPISASNLPGGISLADGSGGSSLYSGYFDFFGQGGTGSSTAGRMASSVNLVVTTIEPALLPLDVPASAPEPATWLLMIAGLGLVGTVQRRQMRLRVGPAFA